MKIGTLQRCAEAMWREDELRESYRRELEEAERLKWRSIRNGFIGTGVIFLIVFGVYWLVRLG